MKLLHKILLATDFSQSANEAMKRSIHLAKIFKSEILILHVIPSMEMSKLNKELIEKGVQAEIKKIYDKIRSEGIKVTDIGIKVGVPFIRIISEADKHNANVIVMGNADMQRERTTADPLGITAAKVLHKSSKPVWIVNSENNTVIENILCPVDFSGPSERALNNAIHLARRMDAELHILHAVPAMSDFYLNFLGNSGEKMAAKIENHQEQLNKFLDQFDFHNVNYHTIVKPGKVHRIILESAKKLSADLIIMGTSGESSNAKILMGNNTEHVIRELPCSIVTVKSEGVIQPMIDYQISDLQSHFDLANEFLSNGMPKEALEQFNYCINLDPLFTPAWEGMAKCYERLGYMESAEEHWEKAKTIQDRLWQQTVQADIRSRHDLYNGKK